MKYPHCTIDLETMGNLPTSAITAIGIVMFDLLGNRHEFEVNVDLQTGMDVGMTVQGETIMWWMSQSKQAQDALKDPKPIALGLALAMVNAYVKQHRMSSFTCWTHATFDAPILNLAFSKFGLRGPIHYREHRDIRTLTWLNRKINGVKENRKAMKEAGLTAHRALDDARNQADYIAGHLIKLGVPGGDITLSGGEVEVPGGICVLGEKHESKKTTNSR